MAELSHSEVIRLVETWQAQYFELGARAEVSHVLIFENRGEAVGVSNPHPHGQIYATNLVFKTIEIELEAEPYHHFHAQFHPPLRLPHLLKYLASPEVGGGCFVSDSAPEQKAEELRRVSKQHYRAAEVLSTSRP